MMRGTLLAFALAVVGLSTVAPAALASKPDIVPPGSTYGGKSYAQWSASWWQWSIAQPAAHHPLSGAVDDRGTADPLRTRSTGQAPWAKDVLSRVSAASLIRRGTW